MDYLGGTRPVGKKTGQEGVMEVLSWKRGTFNTAVEIKSSLGNW